MTFLRFSGALLGVAAVVLTAGCAASSDTDTGAPDAAFAEWHEAQTAQNGSEPFGVVAGAGKSSVSLGLTEIDPQAHVGSISVVCTGAHSITMTVTLASGSTRVAGDAQEVSCDAGLVEVAVPALTPPVGDVLIAVSADDAAWWWAQPLPQR